ncbi:hypothetical protein HDU96_010013 [Phlyctochytrium bullatum]|nr:hypothetical protein HDU96_010013 [Phlyctochytrium bullatum]
MQDLLALPPVAFVLRHPLATLIGVPSLLFLLHLYRITGRSRIRGVPQPPTVPFLGNFHTLLQNMHRRLDKNFEISMQYGPTWTATAPNFSNLHLLLTVDPAIVEHVLKHNFENYVKGRLFTYTMQPLLGDGIFNTDGEHWKWQRKVSSHIFTGRNFRDVIEKVVAEDLDRLIIALDHAAATSTPLDLQTYLHAFTLDSFGKIAFGISFNNLATPSNPPAFAVSFDAANVHLRRLLSMPFPGLVGVLSGTYRALQPHLDVIRGVAEGCVREKLERRQRGKAVEEKEEAARMDLLDLYLEAGVEDEAQLRDMVLNMILAGRDTTAQALTWLFDELIDHPEVVSHIRAETREVLQGRTPGYDDLPKLKYTTAVFLESLRLHPSVPVEFKTSVKPDILPGGIHIPANTLVVWHPYSMGRQPDLWGSDAHLFRPTRWLILPPEATDGFPTSFLDPRVQLRRESPFKFPVFNAGPRTCLGQQMATFEAVATVARVVGAEAFGLERVGGKGMEGEARREAVSVVTTGGRLPTRLYAAEKEDRIVMDLERAYKGVDRLHKGGQTFPQWKGDGGDFRTKK